MALKGQFLERSTLIPTSDDLVLEGMSHRGDRRPGLLILPPSPVERSDMDHPIGAEVAFAASRQGHSTLRFNFRGVRGSQGQLTAQLETLYEDAQAALALAIDNAGGVKPVVASIGASDAVALRLSIEQALLGLVFINPSLVTGADLGMFGNSTVAVIVAEFDAKQDRHLWARSLEACDGLFTVVPGATRSYQRNLPCVGKAVVTLLRQLAM